MRIRYLIIAIIAFGCLAYFLPAPAPVSSGILIKDWSLAKPFGDATKLTDDKTKRIVEISFGEPVSLDDWLFPGKVTIFDFFSKGCSPCRLMRPLIEQRTSEFEGAALRIININRPDVRGIDMESPVALQYKLQAVPHYIVFDAAGKKCAEGQPAHDAIMAWIQESPSREE